MFFMVVNRCSTLCKSVQNPPPILILILVVFEAHESSFQNATTMSNILNCHLQVTSVGINTEWGLLMASISEDTGEETPLQVPPHAPSIIKRKAVVLVVPQSVKTKLIFLQHVIGTFEWSCNFCWYCWAYCCCFSACSPLGQVILIFYVVVVHYDSLNRLRATFNLAML